MTFVPVFAETSKPAEGLTPFPSPLFNIGGFEVNNSMVAASLAAIVVIIVVQLAVRKPQLVPSGLQNFVEWLVEFLSEFTANITGRPTMLRGFWFFAGLFVFIFAENVLALLPGVGTIGFGHPTPDGGFEVTRPFLRGANANVNLTASYATIFFFMWFYWVCRAVGAGGTLKHIFGSQVKFANPIANIFFIFVFFLVGWVEVFSVFIVRPIAFTFRLFGNIFGGEYLLDSVYRMAPNIAFITLIPCYFYETLVAFIQAFVFYVLAIVFTGIFTSAEGQADAH